VNDPWDAIGYLLENGWPGEFDDGAQAAYRTLLDGYQPEQIVAALRSLVRRGGRFRPSVSEIAAELNADPGRPTWSEAYRLLFGQRGFLTVRPEEAALRRANDRHPLLAAFIRQEGYERLTMLPVHDPDWGEKTRRDLERAWERLEERADHRAAAGMAIDAVGRRQQIGPHRPDYLAALPEAPA
jgi:hypothetical protein